MLMLAIGPGAPVLAQTTSSMFSNQVIYDLYATDGYWTMADGTSIYSYGFIGGREGTTISYLDTHLSDPTNAPLDYKVIPPTAGPVTGTEQDIAGNAQFPAPMITCAVGDVVTIRLKNLGVTANPGAPNDPHTIHLHALDVDAANDGVPETSVATIPANGDGLVGAGNVVVYSFTAKTAGTYFYHCHQEADIHVTMGMYGALIVYNRGEAGATTGPGKAGNLFGFRYAKDYVLLMSDTDIRQHASEADPNNPNVAFNPVDYTPQYWFLNGLSFPNTIHAGTDGPFNNWQNWLDAHPGYDPLITGKVATGEKVLVRMINMGFETQPMHIHGFHPKVLGKDQRAWYWSANPLKGLGLEVNTITIGSGEEYDLLIDFSTVKTTSTYNPGTYSKVNPDGSPALNTSNNPAIPEGGDPTAENTYIGGPKVVGAVGLGGTSQIFVFHNHDDYKATNNGAYPGGMFTIVVPQ